MAKDASDVDQLLQLARDARRSKDLVTARAHAEIAIKLAQEVGYPQAELRGLALQGECARRLGSLEEALSCHNRALSLSRQIADTRYEHKTLYDLGGCWSRAGYFEKAISCYKQALALKRAPGERTGEVNVLTGLGAAYAALRNIDSAIECFTEALLCARELGDPSHEALCLTSLATAHSRRDLPKALSFYEQGLTLARRVGSRRIESLVLVNLGRFHQSRRESATAAACFEDALALARATGHRQREGEILRCLGSLYKDIKDFPRAIASLAEAIALLHEAQAFHQEMIAWKRLGRTYLAIANYSQAYKSFRAALALFEAIRGLLLQPRHRVALLESQVGGYRGIVISCIMLGYHDEALEYIERSRSDRLVELLALHDLWAGAPDEIPPLFQEHYARLKGLAYALHVGDQIQPDHTMTHLIQTVFTEANLELEQASSTVRKHHPVVIDVIRGDPLKYRRIQEAIPNGETAIIEFFVTGKTIFAFVILSTGDPLPPVILGDITAQDLADLSNTWLRDYAAFRANPAGNWTVWRATIDSTLSTLYARLFAPIKVILDGHNIKKLIFIPHHSLHLFPLHALCAQGDDEKHYVIDLYDEITYAPSAAALLRCQQRSRALPRHLLVVCNSDSAGRYGTPLKHTSLEIAAILTNYPAARLRKDDETTLDELLTEARDAHILHLICHAFFDFNKPLESYLGLSRDRLTLADIFERLDLPNTSIVVLSACETGVVEISRIDEHIGLPSGFLSAGATTVISSLWMVDDEATSLLMADFYKHLRTGMSPARALTEAQRSLRGFTTRDSDAVAPTAQTRFLHLSGPVPADYSHPYYWAAFALFGSSKTIQDCNVG
jgi:CHAT domain-containing protein/tetratricopeptide (TPR) repeat protein